MTESEIEALVVERDSLRTQLAAAQAEVREANRQRNGMSAALAEELDAHTMTRDKSEERRRVLEANTPRCDCDAPNCAAIRAALKDTPAEAPKVEARATPQEYERMACEVTQLRAQVEEWQDRYAHDQAGMKRLLDEAQSQVEELKQRLGTEAEANHYKAESLKGEKP